MRYDVLRAAQCGDPGWCVLARLRRNDRGPQALLLATRLRDARARDCGVAMMVANVGSQSQRNAERNGFRVAYTRTKWYRAENSH